MPSKSETAEAPQSDVTVAAARLSLLAISYLGFISLGLPDAILGVAWPSLRESFHLPQGSLGLVSIAFGGGYLVSSFCAGKLTLSWGTGTLLTVSSILVALAMLGNSVTPSWVVFLILASVCGLGSGGIDAGLNAYVSSHFSARHMNWLHACYSLGATTGPLIMTTALVHAGSWRLGYAFVGGILAALAVTFAISRRLWQSPVSTPENLNQVTATIRDTLRLPVVWLQILIFFLYTGLELTIGQWTYSVLTESRHVSPELGGGLVAVYFGSIGVGRVVFGAIAERVGLDRLVRLGSLAAVLGMVGFAFFPSWSSVSLTVAGLGLAPIFPCLMARTPQRIGASYAVHAIGFQVAAAMLGAAILPGVAGLLAQEGGLEMVPGYAIVLAVLLWISHEVLVRTK